MTVEEVGMRMKNVLTNEVAEHSPHGHLRREVLQAGHPCHRDRGGRAVSQKLYPGSRILVRHPRSAARASSQPLELRLSRRPLRWLD
jgi:hypothetical protein